MNSYFLSLYCALFPYSQIQFLHQNPPLLIFISLPPTPTLLLTPNQLRPKQNLRRAKPLRTHHKRHAIREAISISVGRGLFFLAGVEGDVAFFFLDLTDDFLLGGRLEVVARASQE